MIHLESINLQIVLRKYDETMLQNVFRTAMSACNTVNEFIDNYLDKKNLI